MVEGVRPETGLVSVLPSVEPRGFKLLFVCNSDGASGTLDSVSILEQITWFEMTFNLDIPQADLTIETFGSVDATGGYLQRH